MFTTQNSSDTFSVLERATFPLVGKVELRLVRYAQNDKVRAGLEMIILL
jgi:hypothetical protein